MIARAKTTWTQEKHRLKVKLGLHRTNTIKLRRRIKQSLGERRFFLYLVSTRVGLLFGTILPLTVIPPTLQRFGESKLQSTEVVLRVFSVLLTSVICVHQLIDHRARFKRLLRRRDRRAAKQSEDA